MLITIYFATLNLQTVNYAALVSLPQGGRHVGIINGTKLENTKVGYYLMT